jgi:CRP-like cAMP-binding protein
MAIEADRLSNLYPLDGLQADNREQVAQETRCEEFVRDAVLFRADDTDEDTIYLLAGTIRGDYPDGRAKRIDAAGLQGRYAIGDLQPRRFTATVESASATVARIDRRFLEKVLTWDQLGRDENFQHQEASPDATRWVFRLLRSRALHRLPSASIERMFREFEEIPARKGQTIIREGDAPDYFYVIKLGAAEVIKDDTRVAQLGHGDIFGEDALLANAPRNATVTMTEDGRLMRLSRKAFEEVLKPPAVDWLSPAAASTLARQGAILVDVRLPEEFAGRAIKGAHNVPLFQLRETVADLDRNGKYIVYCNTGERSAAAAFILHKLGFTVYAIQGGLSGLLKIMERAQPAQPSA